MWEGQFETVSVTELAFSSKIILWKLTDRHSKVAIDISFLFAGNCAVDHKAVKWISPPLVSLTILLRAFLTLHDVYSISL